MPMCTLKEILVAVIILPIHTGCKEIPPLHNSNMSDGARSVHEMLSKVQLKDMIIILRQT